MEVCHGSGRSVTDFLARRSSWVWPAETFEKSRGVSRIGVGLSQTRIWGLTCGNGRSVTSVTDFRGGLFRKDEKGCPWIMPRSVTNGL